MQDRQKIFFISAIVLLAMIALIEGVVLLRNSPHWRDWTTSVSETFRSLAAPKNYPPQTDNGLGEKTGKEDIILQETAEDLENMQNQINRLLYEMTRDTPFARQKNSFATLRSKFRYDLSSTAEAGLREGGSTSQPPDNIRRLQVEIAHIFQRAHESRHNNALHLIEQDWRNVGEISSMNMEEDGTNYVVTISMPGFERTDINISLNGRILTVEAAAEHQQAAQDSRATHSGCFNTQIMLPNDIAGEAAQAFYRDGTLKITVPKKPASNSLARKVTIM